MNLLFREGESSPKSESEIADGTTYFPLEEEVRDGAALCKFLQQVEPTWRQDSCLLLGLKRGGRFGWIPFDQSMATIPRVDDNILVFRKLMPVATSVASDEAERMGIESMASMGDCKVDMAKLIQMFGELAGTISRLSSWMGQLNQIGEMMSQLSSQMGELTQTMESTNAGLQELPKITKGDFNLCNRNVLPVPLSDKEADKIWPKYDNLKGKRILQNNFNSWVQKISANKCNFQLVSDGNKTDGDKILKRCDYSIVPKGKPSVPMLTACLLGLQSSDRSAYNSDRDVADIHYRARKILEQSGGRTRIVAGLTNGIEVEWWVIDGRRVDKTPTYELRNSVAALLTCNVRDLLPNMIEVSPVCNKEVQCLKQLGAGLTSHVYQASYGGNLVVCKSYMSKFTAKYECDVLKKLAGIKNIPAVIAFDQSTLLLEPIIGVSLLSAQNVDEEYLKMFVDLVDILKEVHEHGYVHRDIRIANILLFKKDNEGKAVTLIDWGFAAPKGELFPFMGNIGTGSDSLLEQLQIDLEDRVGHPPLPVKPRSRLPQDIDKVLSCQAQVKNDVETSDGSESMDTEGPSEAKRTKRPLRSGSGCMEASESKRNRVLYTLSDENRDSSIWYEDPQRSKVTLGPSDDLVSLVRSLYIYARKGPQQKWLELDRHDYEGLIDFWSRECSENFWLRDGEKYAKDCDYAKLREWIDRWVSCTR